MRVSSLRRSTRLISAAICPGLGGRFRNSRVKISRVWATVSADFFSAEPMPLQDQEPQGQQRQGHLVRALAALKAGGWPPADPAATPASDRTPPPDKWRPGQPPSQLGPYTVGQELGRVGMGIVYKGHDPALLRPVAIKLLRPDLANERARARFLREARAAARLHHEHVVRVHAVDRTSDGLPYQVMEYIAGPTLGAHIRARRLEPGEAVALIVQVADALAAAHAAGLLHRDVKPGNILLEPAAAGPGTARLTDFGLARDAGEDDTRLTEEGALPGTPAYMSPEQAREAERLDARSDVYSLGATFYEALTGEAPFRGTPPQVLRQVLEEEPPPPRRLNDAVPRELETVCLKALAKEPGRRYPSAAEFAAELRRWQRGEPVLARPVGPWGKALKWARRRPLVAGLTAGLALALLLGLAGVTWQWQRAETNLDEARRQQERAELNFRQARRGVDFFFTRVSNSKLTRGSSWCWPTPLPPWPSAS
jgi:hypothetical protein